MRSLRQINAYYKTNWEKGQLVRLIDQPDAVYRLTGGVRHDVPHLCAKRVNPELIAIYGKGVCYIHPLSIRRYVYTEFDRQTGRPDFTQNH